MQGVIDTECEYLLVTNLSSESVTLNVNKKIGSCEPFNEDNIQVSFCEIKKLNDKYKVNFVKEIKQLNVNSTEMYSERKDINRYLSPTDFKISDKLTDEQYIKVTNLLFKYDDVFSHHEYDLGRTHLAEHHLEVEPNIPISKPPFKHSIRERNAIGEIIEELLENKLIYPSQSPFTSPVFLVPKPDNKFRMVCDYRQLNSITKKTSYPIPLIKDCLNAASGAKYFSSLDANQGFFQVPLSPSSQEKAQFTCHLGTYSWRVCPFGLTGMPFTFQALMDKILGNLKWHTCLVYVDDVLIWGKSFEEHLNRLEDVLKCFRAGNIKLKPSKCDFFEDKLKFLGYILTQDGVEADPEKVNVVKNSPYPKNVKELQRFNGFVNFYKEFIPSFSHLMKPLYNLTKPENKFDFIALHQANLNKIKESLIRAPILAHYKDNLPLIVRTDCSAEAAGVILIQIQDGKERVLAYFSRTLRNYQRRYTATELEALALVLACRQYRQFLHGRPFTVYSDHISLERLKAWKNSNIRLQKFKSELDDYDFKIIHKPAREMADVDYLSRLNAPGVNDIDTPELKRADHQDNP
jgi:hypothetical protein